jgi:hypothetical protein
MQSKVDIGTLLFVFPDLDGRRRRVHMLHRNAVPQKMAKV